MSEIQKCRHGRNFCMGCHASGFEDDAVLDGCRHAQHNPPEHMVIPSGKRYRHVCPGCGNTILIRSSYSNMGML